MRPGLVLTALVCLSTACGGLGEAVDSNHCEDTYCVGGEATDRYTASRPPSPMDLIVVLDDSVVSGPYASRLEGALRELVKNMISPNGGLLTADLNVALLPAASGEASTRMPIPSRLWPETPYCAQPSQPFLHAARLCDAPSNFQGDLADALACAALHLPASAEPPRPLEVIRAFLEPGGPAEATDFRRKSAYLLLAIVSSQDDPTLADAQALATYREFLGTVVEHPAEAILTGVVAPAEARGLAGFAASFGENGAFSEITTESWSAIPFMTNIRWWGDGRPICLDWPVADADPNMEGVQPDCVALEIHLSEAGRTEEILPRCSDDGSRPQPCWRTSWDRCAPNRFEFVVDSPPVACLPSYVVQYSFTCATRYQ
jgi:hypothetical protein